MLFRERLSELVRDKRSMLCVSLDIALPKYRNRYVMPASYLDTYSDIDQAIANFCMDIIDQVCDYSVLVKFNLWYLAQLEHKSTIRQLVLYSRRRSLLTILDCKINDIQDTVEIGLKVIGELGFDCITVNPLPGNLHYVVSALREVSRNVGRSIHIGTLVLTIMSNKESLRYFVESYRKNMALYQAIAEEVRESDSDGCVVGVTYTSPEYVKKIRQIIGESRIIFLVGVGAQGGNIELAKYALPGLTIVNVGRSVVYAENPRSVAESLSQKLRGLVTDVIR